MAEEFGPFTRSQVSEAFRAFDLDGNQYVGAVELRHIFESIGEEVTDEEIDEMIRMVDTDGDGQINEAEFIRMIFRYAAEAPEDENGMPEKKAPAEEPKSQTKPMSQERWLERKAALEEIMSALQIKNQDVLNMIRRYPNTRAASAPGGMIDIQLFAELLQLDVSKHLHRLFALFDPQDTGRINVKEFLVVMTNYARFTHAEKIKFAFELFDEDKNGELSKDEVVRIFKANYLAESPEQVIRKAEALMRQADTNKDNTISYDEFVAVCLKYPTLLFPSV